MQSASGLLIAYIAAASLLTVTPGLDTALVLRTAVTRGAREAVLTGAGIAAGCFAWAALVAFGLGALLAASAFAYTALRWIGAAYLLWLGYKMLRFPRRTFVTGSAVGAGKTQGFSYGLADELY
jgi:threonine/homoserine/homoserine lactone efflux protein